MIIMMLVLTMYFLCICNSIFGSEGQGNSLVIRASVGRLNSGSFLYCDKKYVDFCNKNGIPCESNTPFFAVTYNGLYFQIKDNLARNRLEKITHLPYRFFQEDEKFKSLGAILFKLKFNQFTC